MSRLGSLLGEHFCKACKKRIDITDSFIKNYNRVCYWSTTSAASSRLDYDPPYECAGEHQLKHNRVGRLFWECNKHYLWRINQKKRKGGNVRIHWTGIKA